MEQSDDLTETVVVFTQQVGDGDCHTSANPHHAVDKHVGLLSRLLDEVKGGRKVLGYLVIFVVFHGDVEITRDISFGVGQQAATCHRKDCLDVFACMLEGLLLRRVRFYAAE